MCAKCKKAKRKCGKCKKDAEFKRITQRKPAKGFKVCLRCSRAHVGKYMKGNKTKRVPWIRTKTIGKKRKGGMWLDDDYYLANMPVGDMKKSKSGKYDFLK